MFFSSKIVFDFNFDLLGMRDVKKKKIIMTRDRRQYLVVIYIPYQTGLLQMSQNGT